MDSFKLTQIEIIIFLFELYERTRSRSCMTDLLKTERKRNQIVHPGFCDLLPTSYSIQFMKEGRSPTRGDEILHSDREHAKQRKDRHAQYQIEVLPSTPLLVLLLPSTLKEISNQLTQINHHLDPRMSCFNSSQRKKEIKSNDTYDVSSIFQGVQSGV